MTNPDNQEILRKCLFFWITMITEYHAALNTGVSAEEVALITPYAMNRLRQDLVPVWA